MRCRRFVPEDQRRFADLAGDYNPIHTDPLAARRLIFGSTVVHGIHSVLWALDNWLQGKAASVELNSVRANFSKPIRVGEEVVYSPAREEDGAVEIDLLVSGSVATNLKFNWSRSNRHDADLPSQGHPERGECRSLSPDEVEEASGSLQLYLDRDACASLFQFVARMLPPLQVAQLLAISRLVGTECPGLHSILSGFELSFDAETSVSSALAYEATKLARRLGLVSMEVVSPGMTGSVAAIIRPGSQEQADFADLQEQVVRDEFVGQRALIVGGSRGLGEVTAKILAAGGADVSITYHRGLADARRVVDEIVAGGGAVSAFQLDVLDQSLNLSDKLVGGWRPTHLYYFATPHIFSAQDGVFSPALFDRFCDFYVTGFLNVVNQLEGLGLRKLFYPSTVAIEELPSNMGEYASAKRAGELLCTFLEKNSRDLTIYQPRLPRLATDQTVTLLPAANQRPAPTMLEHLRHLRDLC